MLFCLFQNTAKLNVRGALLNYIYNDELIYFVGKHNRQKYQKCSNQGIDLIRKGR